MRTLKATAAALSVIALAACGTSQGTAPAPVAKAEPAVKTAPAGCASALAALPRVNPATQQEAEADFNAMEAAGKKSTGQAAVLASQGGVDLGYIRMDILMGHSDAADLKTWDGAAASLRRYCRS